jgi:hypothetical protein
MSRFIFELSTPEDGKELLDILEEAAFKGSISLLYTRRPDAYCSLKHEGKHVDIVVCRDMEKGKIVGFGVCVLRKLFVNGKATTVGYLFGLRVRQEYSKKYPLLHRGFEFLHLLHQKQKVPLYLSTILEDNILAQKLFEKRRGIIMPTYRPFGSYEVYAMNVPRRSCSVNKHFRKACDDDVPSLIRFLCEQGKTFQFFPILTKQDLAEGGISGITIDEFYLLPNENNEILAAGALWDQWEYKQYLVQGYGGILKVLYPFSRFFPFFGFPALPKSGSLLKFFTLSFWAVKENDPQLFTLFLDNVCTVSRGDYPFFLIGVHERHPLRQVLQKRPHISYNSKLYGVYWDEQQKAVNSLDKTRLPYLECGML